MDELTPRQRTILGLVVREHVETASPVSSRALVENYGLDVSTATVRNELAQLEELGYLYVTSNGRLYPSSTEAVDGQRQESRRLISQGQLHSMLGEMEKAREAYQQALDIARELGHRRDEAFLAWQLGLLYTETDPARAAELMEICVAYERDIGHPQAEADAEHVARLKARQ